eukprot:m51a1_g8240 hypothetical protein (548) ;mRNA; r:97725-99543
MSTGVLAVAKRALSITPRKMSFASPSQCTPSPAGRGTSAGIRTTASSSLARSTTTPREARRMTIAVSPASPTTPLRSHRTPEAHHKRTFSEGGDDEAAELIRPEEADASSTPRQSVAPAGPGQMRVVLRVRPLLEGERRGNVREGPTSVAVPQSRAGEWKEHSFTSVLGEAAAQGDVCDAADVRAMARDVALGLSDAFVFAYGATGGGKTYTTLGAGGIVECAADAFMSTVPDTSSISLSFLEVYNEAVYDLLQIDEAGEAKLLHIGERADVRGGVWAKGAAELLAGNSESLRKLIERGLARRHVGKTAANAQSSRSHAVISLAVHDNTGEQGSEARVRHMCIVDMAGSERVSRTNAEGERLAEAGNINKSLNVFNRCVKALLDRQTQPQQTVVVPVRESKLTRLTRNCFLDASSRAAIVAAVSPSEESMAETCNTLLFASSVQRVVRSAATEDGVPEAKRRRIAQLEEELAHALAEADSARAEAQALRERVTAAEEQKAHTVADLESLKDQWAREREELLARLRFSERHFRYACKVSPDDDFEDIQ